MLPLMSVVVLDGIVTPNGFHDVVFAFWHSGRLRVKSRMSANVIGCLYIVGLHGLIVYENRGDLREVYHVIL